MLNFKTQSQLADVTASLMRAYLRAATDTFAASTQRSLSLWSELLEAASARDAPAGMNWEPLVQTWWLGPRVTFWAPLTDWRAFPIWRGWDGAAQTTQLSPSSDDATRLASNAGFASYRSADGHAVAQVIVTPA